MEKDSKTKKPCHESESIKFRNLKNCTKVINLIVNSTLLITYYVLSIMFSSTCFEQ